MSERKGRTKGKRDSNPTTLTHVLICSGGMVIASHQDALHSANRRAEEHSLQGCREVFKSIVIVAESKERRRRHQKEA